MPPRTESDEKYILDLVAEVLAEPDYRWQHRFPTLLGDPGSDGTRKPLPVDGFFPRHRLIVEYWERQHSAPVPIMDEGLTNSRVSRGHQRRLYDRRRQEWAEANGMQFVILDYRGFEVDQSGHLRRGSQENRRIVAEVLRAAGVLIEPGRAGVPNTSIPEQGCFICHLVHESPAAFQPSILWQGRDEIALLDSCPTIYGTTIVAPVAHRQQVTRDMTLHQFLALQRVVYAIGEALRLALKPERIYIVAPGNPQGDAHLHWQLVPCPPGAFPEEQPFSFLDRVQRGVLHLSNEEITGLAALLQPHLPPWMRRA